MTAPPDRPRPRGCRPALLLTLTFALACGGARDDAALELWAMGREGEVVGELVRAFERREPGQRVRVQQIPWSAAHEKLLTAFVGGAMPDVFQLGSTWVPEFAALGALEPLAARAAASDTVRLEDYFAGARDACAVQGELLALPWYVDTRLLFYRRDLLAAVGVDAPPATWAGWREALGRLRGRPGAGPPLLLPLGEWEAPVILAWQHGARLLREGGRYGDFRDPAFRAGLAAYRELFASGLAPRAGAAQVGHLYRDFASGYFAAFLSGPWSLDELARRLPPALDGAWATAPVPALGEAPPPGVSIAGGACLAVLRGSPRREAAWRLVEFLSDPRQLAAFHERSGNLPPRASAWRAAGLEDDPQAGAFRTQLAHVRTPPRIPEWEQIAARIARQAEAVVRDDVPVDVAAARLDAEVDAVLEKRRWLLARGAAREVAP